MYGCYYHHMLTAECEGLPWPSGYTLNWRLPARAIAHLSVPEHVSGANDTTLDTKETKTYDFCGCLVTWFCYQLIAKPGNKTATVPWPDPSINLFYIYLYLFAPHSSASFQEKERARQVKAEIREVSQLERWRPATPLLSSVPPAAIQEDSGAPSSLVSRA